MLVLCCFALAGELGDARCSLLLVVVAKCGGCLWDYSLDLFREPADGLGGWVLGLDGPHPGEPCPGWLQALCR
jgi:hypothetical protein